MKTRAAMRKTPSPDADPAGRPENPEHAPFCSRGCKDRDLLKWLGEGYRIPGPPVDSEGLETLLWIKRKAEELFGQVKLVNIDENVTYAGQFGVVSIPALFIFQDGKLVNKTFGAYPKRHLTEWIDESLAAVAQ